MPKTVSTREAKDRLSALIGWAREHADEVIVESRGRPAAVLMPFAEYEKVQALREKQRREAALETLRRLQAEVSAQNRDLTEEQIEELADRATRDAIQALIEKGKLRFQDSAD
jgi:prevent-host-death family protein